MAAHTNDNSEWHTSVDAIAGVFLNYQLHLRFFDARGTGFQQLFTAIMECAFGEDFWAAGTYGNVGDMKCDGYLKPERRVFGLYAPNDFLRRLAEAKRKVATFALQPILSDEEKVGLLGRSFGDKPDPPPGHRRRRSAA